MDSALVAVFAKVASKGEPVRKALEVRLVNLIEYRRFEFRELFGFKLLFFGLFGFRHGFSRPVGLVIPSHAR